MNNTLAVTISSLQNPRIKRLVQLSKPRERRQQEVFVIEGRREIALAMQSGYQFESIFQCPEIAPDDLPPFPKGTETIRISHEVFARVAYRENSDGLIALARPRNHRLNDLFLPVDPLIIVIEAVEKPGNLGAILRTADAAGVDAVIVCDPRTDIYNPNVVRSSVGCLFTVPVATATSQEVHSWLLTHGVQIWSAALTGTKTPYEVPFNRSSAIVMGTEADGLSEFWLKNCTAQIKIPMAGKIDSLNVSTATAIIVFEAIRQRSL